MRLPGGEALTAIARPDPCNLGIIKNSSQGDGTGPRPIDVMMPSANIAGTLSMTKSARLGNDRAGRLEAAPTGPPRPRGTGNKTKISALRYGRY